MQPSLTRRLYGLLCIVFPYQFQEFNPPPMLDILHIYPNSSQGLGSTEDIIKHVIKIVIHKKFSVQSLTHLCKTKTYAKPSNPPATVGQMFAD